MRSSGSSGSDLNSLHAFGPPSPARSVSWGLEHSFHYESSMHSDAPAAAPLDCCGVVAALSVGPVVVPD